MKKQENRLALSVLATLTATIALIYTLIVYHHIVFAVAGMSLIFLITAYILTQNIIAFSAHKSQAADEHIMEYINDITSQIETINSAQSQISKATFLYTKQAAQALAMLENHYLESQEALYKSLTSISNTQNKTTKLMIKYDQNNTTKVISTIKELRAQLSDTMIHGFDQIQPNNDDIISALDDIANYLKSQSAVSDQTLGLQLNNVASELQDIANSIQHIQFATPPVIQPEKMFEEASTIETTISPEQEALYEEEIINETNLAHEQEDLFTEEPVPDANTILDKAETIESFEETKSINAIDSDPNKQLSADEIAALFAAAEPVPRKEDVLQETVKIADSTVEPEEEKPFTPTFTVVGKSEPEEYTNNNTSSNPMTIGDLTEDPNKQLSADEIAALFASADPAPKKVEKPVNDIPSEPTISEDPNKQLSADEIAALFAAAEPAPKKDISDEEKRMNDAIAQAEPVNVAPISEDPNKQLSADEIAALFASLG